MKADIKTGYMGRGGKKCLQGQNSNPQFYFF